MGSERKDYLSVLRMPSARLNTQLNDAPCEPIQTQLSETSFLDEKPLSAPGRRRESFLTSRSADLVCMTGRVSKARSCVGSEADSRESRTDLSHVPGARGRYPRDIPSNWSRSESTPRERQERYDARRSRQDSIWRVSERRETSTPQISDTDLAQISGQTHPWHECRFRHNLAQDFLLLIAAKCHNRLANTEDCLYG